MPPDPARISGWNGIRSGTVRTESPPGDVPSGSKRAPMVFLLAVLAYLVVAFTDASMIPDYAAADRVLPRFVDGAAILGTLVLLVQMMLSHEAHPLFADREAGEQEKSGRGLWETLAWFVGLLVLTSLTGFIIALTLFLLAFFRRRAGRGWAGTALPTAAGISFICLLAGILNRDFPPGLLQEFARLPWPLT